MKKIIVMLLASVMVFSLCACGDGGGKKAAYNLSKEAYNNIDEAYSIVETYGMDIYDAWQIGIFEEDDLSLEYLASKLKLDKDELATGLLYLRFEDEWDSKSEEWKLEQAKFSEQFFDAMAGFYNSKFSLCVEIVSASYKANGKVSEAQAYLSKAKDAIKALSEQYSDFEYYPALKGYYTTTAALLDYCQQPSGSFEYMKTTINDYRNAARDYKNELTLILEE